MIRLQRPVKIKKEQRLRKRRLGMSCVSYLVTQTIVVSFWLQDLLSFSAVLQYFYFASLLNIAFYLLIHSNLNLRFADPSMTALQMVLSVLPALWIFYFTESGHARTILLLIVTVPALYGILALRTGQFVVVNMIMFVTYLFTIGALWLNHPEIVNAPLAVVQSLALLLVLTQIAIVGGFISGLRNKLRQRNQALSDAMDRIQELVNIDELTGVFNRRRLFEVLNEEQNRYSRVQGPFSVCLVDIDFFKHVNDTFGHQAGDEILRTVAQTIKSGLRKIDCFGRYGGEEFLLILPQTAMEGAMKKSERVRHAMEELKFSEISTELRVTVSIGVAEFCGNETVDDTVARADQALYLAKDQGRNQTVSSDGLALPAETLK